MYFIRPATNEDTQAIKEIVFHVLREYNLPRDELGKDADLSNVEQNYFTRGGFFGVVIEPASGKRVGTFGLFPTDANAAELRKMYLLKEARGKGCGRLMMDFAISFSKEAGFRKITLETIGVLKEAISLYRKYGFVEVPPKEVNSRVEQAFELELLL